MRAADELLKAVVLWAGKDDNIRALVLVGSRARAASVDELADIDLQVYARSREPYTDSDGWLSAIGDLWVCVRDQYPDGALVIPTRLAIFAQGVKVDFAFYPAGVVSRGISAGLAHRILLDKDSAIPRADAHPSPGPRAPGEPEFTKAVEEFWFEAYHVAKYLARNDLWLAKARDWATKQLLLKMLVWRVLPAQGADPELWEPGKDLRSWISVETWEDLAGAFARFELEDACHALFATTRLFRKVARETAGRLGFSYPSAVDENVSTFIVGLLNNPSASRPVRPRRGARRGLRQRASPRRRGR